LHPKKKIVKRKKSEMLNKDLFIRTPEKY